MNSVESETTETQESASRDPHSPRVGYKNTPTRTRFKRGQSGNKKGRPIGSRNFCTILEAVLQEAVRVSDGRWISKAQALVKRALYGAMNGESGAVKALDVLADTGLTACAWPDRFWDPAGKYLILNAFQSRSGFANIRRLFPFPLGLLNTGRALVSPS
jgi:hypothetical protein